ncbi:hypothetical protein GDO86_006045 [Hymenochirus boettgeri]|uniref:Cadherin domain-containing protein n=1 Tax=Hymenochirus boettgeri TaxID=247094 RepID=A0A8T2JCC9_9PIPI|nr:hypothetical protein GDO86_006045 [Hymenochirus boettgeri]
MYMIDQTMGDFKYFHMDLPSNGKVLLSRSLDYESKKELEVVIHAVEMTTRHRQRTSAKIHISVLDGDDQYPHFLPCHSMPNDGLSVCISPVYQANITEGQEQAGPLVFYPGPIIAEDGDKGILAPISYFFLSGADNEIFQIDNVTGSVYLTHPLKTSVLLLKVVASQVGDPRKYAIAEVEIRVLAVNQHAPRFMITQYQAFVHQDTNPAALVSTFNGRLLSLMPFDTDFLNGTNPQIHLSLSTQSNHSQLFLITQSGLLIGRANQLRASEIYSLRVIARDEESGETTNCSVIVKVLAHGQADLPIIAGGLGVLVILFGVLLFLLFRAVKVHRLQQQQMSRTSLVTEKHPSVVNPSKSSSQAEDQGYQNAAFTENQGEERITQEKAQRQNKTAQNVVKEPTTTDGHPIKQQKKTPAVAVISPGNQCFRRSPVNNSREKSDDSLNASLTEDNELNSAKVGITHALVTKEYEDNAQPNLSPVESCSMQFVYEQPISPYTSRDIAERTEVAVVWPDPPLLSRLPIVMEVNEEVVEPEEQIDHHHPMGSETITPGSLMQLMDDSIEC